MGGNKQVRWALSNGENTIGGEGGGFSSVTSE